MPVTYMDEIYKKIFKNCCGGKSLKIIKIYNMKEKKRETQQMGQMGQMV